MSLQGTDGVFTKCSMTQCSKEGKYIAKVRCKEQCKSNRTAENHQFCQEHLDIALQGTTTRSSCNHTILVNSYEQLTALAKKRVGDEDRSKFIERLGDAFTGGYLTKEEFDERSYNVYKAKLHKDLAVLTEDLPEPKKTIKVPEQRSVISPKLIWIGVSASFLLWVLLLILLTVL